MDSNFTPCCPVCVLDFYSCQNPVMPFEIRQETVLLSLLPVCGEAQGWRGQRLPPCCLAALELQCPTSSRPLEAQLDVNKVTAGAFPLNFGTSLSGDRPIYLVLMSKGFHPAFCCSHNDSRPLLYIRTSWEGAITFWMTCFQAGGLNTPIVSFLCDHVEQPRLNPLVQN